MIKYYLFLIVIIHAIGCKTIEPVGPTLPQTPINTSPLPPSIIKAPITIDLTKAFQDLNASIPPTYGQETQISGSAKYSWYINRTPIDPSFNPDGSLTINDGGGWGVEVKVKNFMVLTK